MLSYLLGLIAFCLFFCWIIVMLNFLNVRAIFSVLSFSSLAFYILMIIVAYLAKKHLLFWSYSSVYWFLVLLFFFVFFGLVKSVSIRVLFDLLNSTNLKLDYQYLLNEYLIKESYNRRINLLIENKMINLQNGKIVLMKKGRILAAVVAKIQKIFSVRESG